MMSLNRVTVIGNLTRDPDLRKTASGRPVGGFRVAVNERYTTRDGEAREEVCFLDVEVWGRQAEACGDHLRKGASVFVDGRLRQERWEDRESGAPRSRLLVCADRVQFLSTAAEAERGSGARAPAA